MSSRQALETEVCIRSTTWLKVWDLFWTTTIAILLGCVMCLGMVQVSSAGELPLVTSARGLELSAPPATQPEATMGTLQQQVIASLPQTKMPQYQVGSSARRELSEDGVICWLLRVSERTVKIETVMRIDQKPFQHARRDALTRVLKSSTDEVSADTSELQPTFTLATTPSELLRRYASATNRDLEAIDLDEACHLVSEMLLGPELMMVKSRFQAFRAQQRPYFIVLDRDRDGTLSADEIQTAETSLIECDTDRNEIVEIEEIEEAAKDPRLNAQSEDASSLGIMDASDELLQLVSADDLTSFVPELVFEIDFNTTDPSESSMSLVRVESPQDAKCSVNANQIDVQFDQVMVTFSTIQSVQKPDQDQISVGAVVDGYPLVMAVDPNADGRITIRERRDCATRLLAYDTDGDGQIASDEAQSPLRVSFGFGPIVHMDLARLRDPAMPTTNPTLVAPPEWFARMDSNTDGDLSRREFSGTDEQFRQLDTDDDQLISSAEANQTP